MKIMRFVLFAILTLSLSMGKAQLMEAETKIMDSPKGEASFQLEANVEVYSYPSDGVWIKVSREAWIKKEDLIGDEFLAEDTELANKEGDKIGQTVAELKVTEKKLVEGFRGKDRYQIILTGYVYGSKFKEGTVPEKRVSELLAIKNKSKQNEGFDQLYDALKFEKREYEGFTVYALYENHKSLEEEKDYRLFIVYRGTTMIVGVFTHNGHVVTAPKIKDSFEDGEQKGIYILKLPAKQKAFVEEDIRYDFLAL